MRARDPSSDGRLDAPARMAAVERATLGEEGDAAQSPRRETLRPADRIKRRVDFRRVQQSGRKIHTPHYVLAVLPRPEGGPTRLGITVTRKVAPAVGRNRIKRVMREVFRRHRELFPDACDVVVIAKEGARALGYEEALGELQHVGRALQSANRPRGPRRPPPVGGTS